MRREDKILKLVKEADPIDPVGYVRRIVSDYALEKLRDYIVKCEDCPIHCGIKTIPKGNAGAEVMFVGEALSEEQIYLSDRTWHYPFENTHGWEILETVFDYFHINRDALFFANTINCFPHAEVNGQILGRVPSKSEVENCRAFLDYTIEVVRPKAIVLLGAVSLNAFKKGAISKERGQWFEIKGIPAVATYHPEYFRQIEGRKPPEIVEELKIDFVEDLKSVFLYIQNNFPDNKLITKPISEND